MKVEEINMAEEMRRLDRIIQEIWENEKEEITEYYGVQIPTYRHIDTYLEQLPNIEEKIRIAQACNNKEKIAELTSQIQLDEYQTELYKKLKEHNNELDETLNFKLLNPKYEFLGNLLDAMSTDRTVQDELVSLSDERLELFKIMYCRLQEVSKYNVPYVSCILRRLGYTFPETSWKNRFHQYDDLTTELEKQLQETGTLDDNLVDSLLFLYARPISWNVHTIEEVKELNTPNSKILQEQNQIVQEEKESSKKDIARLKSALLAIAYGLDWKTARNICKKYHMERLERTEDNEDLFEMYQAISSIVKEENPDTIIAVYEMFQKEMPFELEFMNITTFEEDLRKEFAKSLNQSVWKLQGEPVQRLDGIPVYDAGTDFKMIITSLGAYQSDFTKQANYFTYWNSPEIISHGNCCSLIANNNLSMVDPKTVILGFETMDESMLLLAGNQDLNSTPSSKDFNLLEHDDINAYMTADQYVDETRGSFNELVYERRDLSANPKFYKKNPDYIVVIEEYENIDETIKRYQNQPEIVEELWKQKELQEYHLQEAVKASKDFGIPIVKINRERCAKKGIEKVSEMLVELSTSKDPKWIPKIITEFENNRVGNNENHKIIREQYFSQEKMQQIQSQIETMIETEPDFVIRRQLLLGYEEAVQQELERVKKCYYNRVNGQESGINFDATQKRIQSLKEEITPRPIIIPDEVELGGKKL